MSQTATLRRRRPHRFANQLLALGCAFLLLPGAIPALPQSAPQVPPASPAPAPAPEEAEPPIPPEQLDSLVAPVALYPDPLLAQTLVAATYPLEIVQLQQWLAKNPDLKDKALVDAVAKQPWDPAIQSMAAVPDVVKRLADDIQWTTDLGNAFLAQQADVMDAVQRMRQKASGKGALETNEQQIVQTKVIEEKTVIVVEPADPEVIYVPSYNPTVVYGAPVYPYPPVYYPPPYPYGAGLVGFGVGVVWGAAWGGSCCGCGWGGGDVDINVDNNFNRNTNVDRGNTSNKWNHNPQHRGGAPYSNKATASKYGGQARGSGQRAPSASTANRGGAGATSGRGAAPSTADRSAGGTGSRGGAPSAADRSAGGTGSRGAAPSAADRSAGGGSASRGSSSAQVGSRNVPTSSKPSSSAFSGGSHGHSGSSARASSSRGASSMGGRSGGGSRGGGGGRRR